MAGHSVPIWAHPFWPEVRHQATHPAVVTTAWPISMGRRQVVESANAPLKGAFANLSQSFFRVMGLVKQTILLGFTLAAYNLDRVRSNNPTRPSTVGMTVAR